MELEGLWAAPLSGSGWGAGPHFSTHTSGLTAVPLRAEEAGWGLAEWLCLGCPAHPPFLATRVISGGVSKTVWVRIEFNARAVGFHEVRVLLGPVAEESPGRGLAAGEQVCLGRSLCPRHHLCSRLCPSEGQAFRQLRGLSGLPRPTALSHQPPHGPACPCFCKASPLHTHTHTLMYSHTHTDTHTHTKTTITKQSGSNLPKVT